MIHLIGQTVGWVCIVSLLVLLVINASFMLVNPRAWLDLPVWLTQRATKFTHERYGQGYGAVQLRLCGAAILGLIVYCLWGSLSHPH